MSTLSQIWSPSCHFIKNCITNNSWNVVHFLFNDAFFTTVHKLGVIGDLTTVVTCNGGLKTVFESRKARIHYVENWSNILSEGHLQININIDIIDEQTVLSTGLIISLTIKITS